MVKETIQALRGVPDTLPAVAEVYRYLENQFADTVRQAGYAEVRLPLLEKTALFKRAIGEVTDIVEKEMFTLQDRDGESIALRPEGTAGAVRLGIEHGLFYHQTQKWWYQGPMFRYERPQKGRYRQFHQLGLEAFGFPGQDVEIEQLRLAEAFFKRCGVREALVLELNYLGTLEERQAYRQALLSHLLPQITHFSEEAQLRLHRNPLRLLDSKDPAVQDRLSQVPLLSDFWGADSQVAFSRLRAYCEALGLSYKINPRLVRGLDYYNGLVYEWTTQALGAQGTVCAGGRYDSLVAQLGGTPTPAVGFGIGLERLQLLCEQLQSASLSKPPQAYLIYENAADYILALRLAESIQATCPGLAIQVHLNAGTLKHQFKRADKSGADWVFILGEREKQAQQLSIKALRDRSLAQETRAWDTMADWYAAQIRSRGT